MGNRSKYSTLTKTLMARQLHRLLIHYESSRMKVWVILGHLNHYGNLLGFFAIRTVWYQCRFVWNYEKSGNFSFCDWRFFPTFRTTAQWGCIASILRSWLSSRKEETSRGQFSPFFIVMSRRACLFKCLSIKCLLNV